MSIQWKGIGSNFATDFAMAEVKVEGPEDGVNRAMRELAAIRATPAVREDNPVGTRTGIAATRSDFYTGISAWRL